MTRPILAQNEPTPAERREKCLHRLQVAGYILGMVLAVLLMVSGARMLGL